MGGSGACTNLTPAAVLLKSVTLKDNFNGRYAAANHYIVKDINHTYKVNALWSPVLGI
jgi:hypothetical protein